MRLGQSVAQTPAHTPTTDARQVSITSTGMDIEMQDSAFGETLKQEERYNPFQGIDDLDGCSLAGLGSALSRQKTLVVRGVRKMETICMAFWHRGAVVLRPPGRQAFTGPRASCGGTDVAKAEPGWCIFPHKARCSRGRSMSAALMQGHCLRRRPDIKRHM